MRYSSVTQFVGVSRQVVAFVDRGFALAFDRPHLLGIVAIVRERPVDIGHVEIVAIGAGSRIEPPLLNLLFDELSGNPSAFEMWLVVYLQTNCPS